MKKLPHDWASPEDFATLFQYFWYRDFPIDLKSTGAKRIDWTIHIGIIVRNIGDLIGLVTRFERGGRKDAVYRSVAGDEIALEWEWQGIIGENEINKLKDHKPWGREGYNHSLLKYGVLVSYLENQNADNTLSWVSEKWAGAQWPLVLAVIESRKSTKLTSKRFFHQLMFYHFAQDGRYCLLRKASALPWEIDCSRWQYNLT